MPPAGTTGQGATGAGGRRGLVPRGERRQRTSAAPRPAPAANPLLGGLDQTASRGRDRRHAHHANDQNNAVLVYGTPQEDGTVVAMLRKIDILPLQVRIDATIAEVTLNDQLQYGTQFFFKSGGINGILNNADANRCGPPTSRPPSSARASRASSSAAPAWPARRSPSPRCRRSPRSMCCPRRELMVLDNQPARLQVGSLVPYLTATSQSTLVSDAPVINSVDYQQTGVIMDVTPRVNSGGLVTLDITQEVSDVDTNPPCPRPGGRFARPSTNATCISRVVVQDGQTVGLAGLIKDDVSRGNSGIPWLKDIPLLGALAGTQNNQRTRTELLVLITPHVIHDQHEARALTEDMREQLINAALVPQELQGLPASGSADPNRALRQNVGKWIGGQ